MEETNRPQPQKRRRKRRSPFQRFMRRYFPSIALLLMTIACVSVVVVTISTISAVLRDRQQPSESQPQIEATVTQPTEDPRLEEAEALIPQADKLAAGYDYLGAIELLKSFENYEEYAMLTDKIAEYTEADSKLIPYTDLDNVTHLFFHSLIVDTDRAFDKDYEQDGYNLYMVTVKEFKAILQQMYDRGYVLVSPYDIAYETTGPSGNTYFTYGSIRLPEGKKPFMLSQDDVNYYGYMIGNASGVDETPIFTNPKGDGFASRIVIDENGYPTCEYMDAQGNVTTGEYDIVPILENFIQEHPDFSYHGARAILGVTGYEGVFGYRTKPSYKAALGEEAYAKEVEEAKKVAQCLRDHGWILASHTYGHLAYGGTTSAERVATDSAKWEDTVQPIIGETDVILFAHGSDIAGVEYYTDKNQKFTTLYNDGYRYFFNVDSRIAWTQIGDNYFRGSRRNIDGYRMYHSPQRLEDLFDVDAVFDPARPTPVPTI